MMSRQLLVVFLIAACNEATNQPVTQLNLDRPVDMAFTCFGGLRLTNGGAATPTQEVVVSAQPYESCNIRSDVPLEGQTGIPFGQEDLTSMGGRSVPGVSWYGFILESAAGTVAVAQFAAKPTSSYSSNDTSVSVVDTDPLTPGKNSITVGEDPVAIATDKLGCYVMTANAGSLDLSLLDVTSALDTDPAIRVNRRDVKNAAVPAAAIRSKPAAMVAEPPKVPANSAEIGVACGPEPAGLLYIAYPSCHLVAAVEANTGTIVAGIQYNALGVPTVVGGNVTCPDDVTVGPRPVTLDLEVDTMQRRLVIGADNSASIAVVELNESFLPMSVFQVPLDNPTGALGITHVALSSKIGIGGATTMIFDPEAPGGDFQFVYAVATDDTVRVADILDVRRECDTQIDPRFLRANTNIRQLGCMPLNDPAFPRRAGARGPGIDVGVPLSVDIFRSETITVPMADTRGVTPLRLIGYFAVISTATGGSFVINIDDDHHPDLFDPVRPLSVPIGNAIAHQVRDAITERSDLADLEVQDPAFPDDPSKKIVVPVCNSNGSGTADGIPIGGPRAAGAPVRNIPTGALATEKQGSTPFFRQYRCVGNDTDASGRVVSELSFSADPVVRDREFPDLRALARDETWSVTWEGSLSLDRPDVAIDGPPVRESQMVVGDGGSWMVDDTKPYCDAGVESFDIVQLRGCDPNAGDVDCPVGYRCFVHPQSQVQGLGACMLRDEADRLADACKDFLTSFRRYTVRAPESGKIELVPRRHELTTSPLGGCTSNEQCELLADYAARAASAQHPVDDRTPADPRTWACHEDLTRAPIPPNNKRCVMKCDTTADCATGTICSGAVAGQAMSGFCLEGVTPPQACVNAPQRYELRAGEAFAVVGSVSGYLHNIVAETPSNKCVKSTTANPYQVGRIKLDPPACQAPVESLSGRRMDNTFDANPCATTVPNTDLAPNYVPGSCAVDVQPTVIRDRPTAPALVFRNPALNLTIVDPYYPGDLTCHLDRMGNLGRIPQVFPGFQLAFRQLAGFYPFQLSVTGAVPVKVLRGPTDSIWIIDQGDFLSQTVTEPSTRGRVFRIEIQRPGVVNTLR